MKERAEVLARLTAMPGLAPLMSLKVKTIFAASVERRMIFSLPFFFISGIYYSG
jgi:hypothetical protein